MCPTNASTSLASPVAAPGDAASNVNGASLAAPVPSTGPQLTVLLRPIATPTPIVHVEIELDPRTAADALRKLDLTKWHLTGGSADRIARPSAHDAKGDVGVGVAASASAGSGVDLVLARSPSGVLRIGYDVVAGDDAPDDPLGLLVQDDRFRGAGEKLIALPASIENAVMPVLLKIDGEPLRADKAASSLGVGAVRRASLPPRALRYSSFVAGSLGAEVIDAPEGHDEGAWLGYTAFDPRPVVAELAQVRTTLAEFFNAAGLNPSAPWTYLLVARTRATGPFATTPRFESTLLQVEPGQAWTGPVKLSMAQQLTRQWIGQTIRFTPAGGTGHEWELAWFNDGVARYVATLLLARMGLLTASDWRDAIAGELSVLATSPYAAQGNAALAGLAAKDPIARATLLARGALYAARESAAIEARSKGDKRLQSVLIALLKQAETDNGATNALPESAWLDALAKDDPDAAKTFDAIVTKGGPVTLPPNALGPCFRAAMGEYVAFDAGFDVDATRLEHEGKVVGVREGGPAAKAGLKDGDVLDSMVAREDDATVPVKLVVTRAGQKVNVNSTSRAGRTGRGRRGRG